ncbi:DUF917 domain-containing protein [Pseudonocardia eucalypti]|uniref:DUF917 domain-containing protein n=1 Tax=Pseudonocardia eucalypti TaxID=648755 RepID=A0ABP9PQP4_9PSEU|nr:DUF917 family protein [Pseudonocardia eucalypti]
MARYVGVGDVDHLVRGAAVLGSGGGGDGYVPRQMLLAAIERYGPVPLVDAAEMDADAPVLPVIGAGAPATLVEMFPGDAESERLRELVETAAGRPCEAVLPLQPGPVNAALPLVVAAQLGLPCLDADAMCRVFPMVEMTLFTLAGISPAPLFAVDAKDARVMLSAPDHRTVSALLRSCLPELSLVALISTYQVTAGQCARYAANGGLSRCLRIGRALTESLTESLTGSLAEPLAGLSAESLAEFGGVPLVRGVVAELVQRSDPTGTDGFPRGVLSVQSLDDPSRVLRVDFQNENLVAAEDGVVRVTVPDLINVIDTDTGAVMQTVDLVVGQRVHVVAMPADPRWHTDDGIALAGPRAFGYDIEPVRV